MKKLFLALAFSLFACAGSSAFAQNTPPANCPNLSSGVIRDGVTTCNNFLAVNSDGSINTIITGGGSLTNYALETGGNLAGIHTDTSVLVAGLANPVPVVGTDGINKTSSTNPLDTIARASSAIIGKVGIDQTTPGTTNAVQPVAGTTGGATPYGLQSAASTNSTNVKASAGTLYGINLINTTTTIYYLRMYDSSSAPTCSSATNFSRTWPIPPASSSGLAGGIAGKLPEMGVAFANGISFCLTGGGSSTDNTNAATGVYVNLDYK